MIGLGRHPINLASTSPSFYSRLESRLLNLATQSAVEEFSVTTIGNDVWVGARAIVLGGLHIGDGAVIGAGAVVTRNVDSYTVVGGVPARPLRARFPSDVAKMLRESKWWDLPINELKGIAEKATDPAEFAKSASEIWHKLKCSGRWC
jgi:virginiamycin A acetyltransferase